MSRPRVAQDPLSGAIWAPLSQRLAGVWGSFGPRRLQKHLYGIYQELSILRVLPLDPPNPRCSPGPTAPNSLSGPRTKVTPQASAKLELSTTWGDLHFRLFTPDPLAGRDRAADRFVCLSSFGFVWFVKLSTWLGSKRSYRLRCEPLSACLPHCPALPCAQRGRQGPGDRVHLPPSPSGFWTQQATGTRGQEKNTDVCSPGRSRQAGPTAEATVPRDNPFFQPNPEAGPSPSLISGYLPVTSIQVPLQPL